MNRNAPAENLENTTENSNVVTSNKHATKTVFSLFVEKQKIVLLSSSCAVASMEFSIPLIPARVKIFLIHYGDSITLEGYLLPSEKQRATAILPRFGG